MATAWSKPSTPRADPNVAALLTWFLPGAGHLYIGRPVFAFAAFLVVEGVFWLGLRLSDGMTFEFLQQELRVRLAPALTPEAGNLGAIPYQMKSYGYGSPFPRPWPEYVKLGTVLTATSGILNVCLMVRAHVDARLTKVQKSRGLCPSLTVFAGWLVPGLGHVLQGRRTRGVVVFLLIVGMFALATLLAEGSNLDRERHFYYWAGQFMLGAPALLAEALHGHAPVTSEILYADAGVVIGCLAGLLNILAMLDVFTQSEAILLDDAKPESESGGEDLEEYGAPV